MSDIDVLKKLIRHEYLGVPSQDTYGKPYLKLTEPKAGYEITIWNVPENSLAVKADEFKGGERFFSGEHGECRRADTIVFSETSDQLLVLCVELTQAKKKWSEIEYQLMGSKCLLDYIDSIARHFLASPLSIGDAAVFFMKIGNIDKKSLMKRRTQNTTQFVESEKLGKVLVLSNPKRIDFKTLIKKGKP